MFCRKKDEGNSGLKERLVKVDDPVLRQKTAEDWANLKKRISDAIKKDEQPEVFEALVTEVNDFVNEAKRNQQIDNISIDLQDDANVFFTRRNLLSEADSKQALQKINNALKNQ